MQKVTTSPDCKMIKLVIPVYIMIYNNVPGKLGGSLHSVAVLLSQAHEQQSRGKNKVAPTPISLRFLCPRPPLLLSAPNQNRHATQANWEENLVVYQKSLGALFQALLLFCWYLLLQYEHLQCELLWRRWLNVCPSCEKIFKYNFSESYWSCY